ncbi:MAG: T9SS type A sorting domain-containing protein [Prolixibacteraceae bacterium]
MKQKNHRNTTRAFMVLSLLIILFGPVAGQLKSSQEAKNEFFHFAQNEGDANQPFYLSSSSIQDAFVKSDVSEIRANKTLIQNGIKLDSIYELQSNGWQIRRFINQFEYKNEVLTTKRRDHFKSSFTDSLGIREVWNYNNSQQVIRYTKLKKLEEWNDTMVVDEEILYTYFGDTLIVQNVSKLNYFFFNATTYNGDPYPAGSALYDTSKVAYYYNNFGKLIRTEGSGYYDLIQYQYDDLGRLVYQFWPPNFVVKYDYFLSDTLKVITIKWHQFDEEAVDFDSISSWSFNTSYSYRLDQFGRDSICTTNHYNHYFSSSSYEYNSNNKLAHQSFSFRDDTDSTLWLELGRIDYVYNQDLNPIEMHQSYFDEGWEEWRTQRQLNYYYSAVKSVELPEEQAPTNPTIYPNPVSNVLNVHVENGSTVNYHIYDLFGHQIIEGNLLNPAIDVSGLARGTYLLKLTNVHKIDIKRFVKK